MKLMRLPGSFLFWLSGTSNNSVSENFSVLTTVISFLSGLSPKPILLLSRLFSVQQLTSFVCCLVHQLIFFSNLFSLPFKVFPCLFSFKYHMKPASFACSSSLFSIACLWQEFGLCRTHSFGACLCISESYIFTAALFPRGARVTEWKSHMDFFSRFPPFSS